MLIRSFIYSTEGPHPRVLVEPVPRTDPMFWTPHPTGGPSRLPALTPPSSYIKWPQEAPFTSRLEIECHHLGAAQPEAEGVVVGGVHPLSLWVNTGQALLIVLQELDGFLSDDAVGLRLHKGTDFSEVGILCRQDRGTAYFVSPALP